jgi:dolichyl-phosphate-mannose--protein O-mannosyl transferase
VETIDRSAWTMETEKVLTYAAMIVAGLVGLIFLLDATLAVLGRNIVLDILFILGAAFVVWQGFETSREFR